jgi:transcription elongation GreA/GreB family factor
MGKKLGDSVSITTPSGRREFEIRAVLTIHEQA